MCFPHPPLLLQLTTCCFDKTGTLTSDHMELEGVAGAAGHEGSLVADVKSLPPAVSRVLACCQSLLQVRFCGSVCFLFWVLACCQACCRCAEVGCSGEAASQRTPPAAGSAGVGVERVESHPCPLLQVGKGLVGGPVEHAPV